MDLVALLEDTEEAAAARKQWYQSLLEERRRNPRLCMREALVIPFKVDDPEAPGTPRIDPLIATVKEHMRVIEMDRQVQNFPIPEDTVKVPPTILQRVKQLLRG